MDEAVDLIQVRAGLCALDIQLSYRKSSFIYKLSCLPNSIIIDSQSLCSSCELVNCIVLCVFSFFFLLLHFIVLCLSCLSAAVVANKDL